MPDASIIGFDGHSSCRPTARALRALGIDRCGLAPSVSMEWGCATYTNLAAQIAHPKDLVAPQALGPADAAVAAERGAPL
jgi:pilus assembly protein CpaD